MKNYAVGYLTFFENELKMFKIQAESEYEAIKKAMVESATKEEYKQDELEWQKSEKYPDNLEDLIEMLYNSDVVVNAIEV
jgi:hypothetical protein